MAKNAIDRAHAEFERHERNTLFEEFETQAVRVSQECARSPYGDFPGTENDLFAFTLDILTSLPAASQSKEIMSRGIALARKNRPRGIGWLSIHGYVFNRHSGYAAFYERREKGTGYYYRLRTIEDAPDFAEPATTITDYAVKTSSPGRSINWLAVTRANFDGEILARVDGQPRGIWDDFDDRLAPGGTDLKPGIMRPQTQREYDAIKISLIKSVSLLEKLQRTTLITDLSFLQPPISDALAYPLVFHMGVKF